MLVLTAALVALRVLEAIVRAMLVIPRRILASALELGFQSGRWAALLALGLVAVGCALGAGTLTMLLAVGFGYLSPFAGGLAITGFASAVAIVAWVCVRRARRRAFEIVVGRDL